MGGVSNDRSLTSSMLIMSVFQTCKNSRKDECADEEDHESRSDHVTAMLLMFSTLSCRKLHVALFAMNMRLRLENSCDSLYERFRCVHGCRGRAGRSVGVAMGVRVKFDIVVLCDRDILRSLSAELYSLIIHLLPGEHTLDAEPAGAYRFTGWSPKTSS